MLAVFAVPALVSAAAAQGFGGGSGRGRFDEQGLLNTYSIDSTPHGARLVLEGPNRLAGLSPLAIPADVSGTYRLRLTHPGYVTRRAILTLPGGGQPLAVQGPFARLSAAAVVGALLWPGAAELRGGDRLRGLGWFAAGTTGAVATTVAHLRLHDHIDAAAAARRKLRDSTDIGGSAEAATEVVRQDAAVERASRARRDWAVVTGAVWGLAVLDHFLLTPGSGAVDVQLTEVDFRLAPMSRSQAAWRSIIPGLGQLYGRRGHAAALSVFGALAAGTGLLVAEHAYREAVDRVAGLEALYEDPRTDPETLAALRPVLEDEVAGADARRTTRNVLIGVSAAVWALGIVEAYLETPVPSPEPFSSRRPATTARGSPELAAAIAPGPAGGVRVAFCLGF